MILENSKDFYESEAQNYDDKRWLTPSGKMVNVVQQEIFRELAEDIEGLKVLEIGAGTGRFTKILMEQGNFVKALDTSASMLDQLKKRLNGHPYYTHLQTIISDARKMDIETSSVDVVVTINALSHIPEYKKVFVEILRVLKQGGTFIFNIPNYLSIYFPFAIYVNLRKKSITRNVYTKWYTFKEIANELQSLGFEIESIRGQLHIPPVTPRLIIPVIQRIDRKIRNSSGVKLSPILFIKTKKTR
jgi:ubiquinone/menaquinone biosynthesis C-methylase UbiE